MPKRRQGVPLSSASKRWLARAQTKSGVARYRTKAFATEQSAWQWAEDTVAKYRSTRNQLGKDPFTGDAFVFVGIPPQNTLPIPCLACPRSGFSCGRLATDHNCPNALIQRWFCSHTVK